MRTLAHLAFSIGAVALFAGCGVLPLSSSKGQNDMELPAGVSAAVQTGVIGVRARGLRSWMLPEAKSEDLLYASDNTGSKVWVFSYPKGKLVGTLTGFYAPMGACVDTAGNVWIVNWKPAEVIEYAHGGTTRRATLPAGGSPFGCAIDPRTGNLAVVNYLYGGNVKILVFPSAQYPPTSYSASDFGALEYCG